MRILYGVASEGMGHATRSLAVIEHLRAAGHVVATVSDGRAAELLRRHGVQVVRVDALSLHYRDGGLRVAESVARNLARLPAMVADAARAVAHADAFAPDAVVTDFDPGACSYARLRGLRCLALDNINMLARCLHDPAVFGTGATGAVVANAWARTPLCDHYVIPTFFYPPVRPELASSTTLVPSVVRRAVLDARASAGAHVLVYQTATGDAPRVLAALRAHRAQRFVVYGLGLGETIDGNVTLRAPSDAGFVRDLASARGVITNGGMSLLGEAVYLGKPALSVPLREHPEQQMNAHYLAAMMLGQRAEVFTADAVGAFLDELPYLSGVLAPSRERNRAAFAAVDAWLARVAATR